MFSRRGCATCRTRRIRCDRSLPRCQKCTRSNRLCIARKDLAVEPLTGRRHSDRARTRSSPCTPSIHQIARTNPHHYIFLWRNGKEPHIQNAIDYFLTNFALNDETLSQIVGKDSIEIFDIVLAENGPGRAVLDVLGSLTPSFLILRTASFQTIDGRRQQHMKYQAAMRVLRESISLHPKSRVFVAPIFLFALYEVS